MKPQVTIERVEARAYRIPTERPESDGTLRWDATTLVAVHVTAGGVRGFGYGYGSAAAARVVRDLLAPRITGEDALRVERLWNRLVGEVRNVGRQGIAATAVSAVDAALWDLAGKLLDLPLFRLLGGAHDQVAAYGSGGFTSYTEAQLAEQLGGWAEAGFTRVKMKVGSQPEADPGRVAAARRAVGDRVALMVDANGAYGRAQAAGLASAFAQAGVGWFEEPVSSDDLEGLRWVLGHVPPGMDVAAGEFAWDTQGFRRFLESGAVSVLQADATRCLGITGFLAAARLCQAFCLPLSTHTAPSLHLHPACAATPVIHLEWFHDHARIERLLFEGFAAPSGGWLRPDPSRPGLGVELKRTDAEPFAV